MRKFDFNILEHNIVQLGLLVAIIGIILLYTSNIILSFYFMLGGLIIILISVIHWLLRNRKFGDKNEYKRNS